MKRANSVGTTIALLSSVLPVILILTFVDGFSYDWHRYWASVMLEASKGVGALKWIAINSSYIFGVFAAFAARIFIFAALCGSIITVLKEEELIIGVDLLKKNAFAFWTHILCYEALLRLIRHFVISIFPSGNMLLLNIAYAILFVCMVLFLIDSSYKPGEKRPVLISGAGLLNMLKAALAYIAYKFLLETTIGVLPQNLILLRVALIFGNVFLVFVLIYSFVLFLSNKEHISDAERNRPELIIIQPCWVGLWAGIASMFMRLYPPFFSVLHGLTPERYKITEFNAVFWRNRYYKGNVLVAISCFSATSYRAYKIAKEFRKRGATVIMGGPHVTHYSDEALEFCDAVVTAEAEAVWQQVIDDYENGSLQKKYIGVPLDNYSDSTHKRLLQCEDKVSRAYFETTRGCKYDCDFCSIPNLSRKKIRHKPVEQVVEQINNLKSERKFVNFMDNNIYADPVYSKELFRAMAPLGVAWTSCCSVDIARNDEALELAAKSGCKGILIGYEITPASAQSDIGGKYAFAQKYAEMSKKIRSKGISIRANFIFGFDKDSWHTIRDIFVLCWKVQPTYSVISLLTPLPGTRLFANMLKARRIRTLNWQRYDIRHLVFKPECMGPLRAVATFQFAYYLVMFLTGTKGRKLFFIILAYLALVAFWL